MEDKKQIYHNKLNCIILYNHYSWLEEAQLFSVFWFFYIMVQTKAV